MPNNFIIRGGNLLSGTVDVRGSKNAALPILVSTILTKDTCKIYNLPLVQDVYQILGILEKMGSEIKWVGKRSISVRNKEINPRMLDSDAVKKMRASILLLGPLLARFGRVERMRYPGGCSIGARPIDTHLKAFEDLGANIELRKNFFSIEMPRRLKNPPIVVLNEFSVTATENILMFLSSIPMESHVKIAACEPHVQDLAKFLLKMGSRIYGAGTHTIRILGARKLIGASHKITPDYIEAGTFILAVLSVGGNVRIKNVPISHLDFVIKKLVSAGAGIKLLPKENTVEVVSAFSGSDSLGKKMKLVSVQSMPHPGIPTDLQSAFCVLATQTHGITRIHEPLYEKRLTCLRELNKLQAKTKTYDPHRADVWGSSRLLGAKVESRDLRGGTALVIAGLAAQGTTIVCHSEHIERGHEDLAGRLRALGADIQKI